MGVVVSADRVRAALREVEEPTLGQDVVEAGMVHDLVVEGSRVTLRLMLPVPRFPGDETVEGECRAALEELAGVDRVELAVGVEVPAFDPASAWRGVAAPGRQDPWQEQAPIPGVRNLVAVASGKGGVGKSTVAVNLAAALARVGARVGLMDADIHGPSGPLMMGVAGRPRLVDDKLEPLEAHGVKLMSIGLLTGNEDAQVWRGPMVQSAVRQFVRDVAWGELDYLLVDMPPGTGDAQLTLTQQAPLTGAVIVSTPQEVALLDVRKGISMFRKVHVEILGLIENMSWFECDGCGKRHEIFASGGATREAERQGVPFLGAIPLAPAAREGGDRGTPVVLSAPDSPQGKAFMAAAAAMARQVARRASRRGAQALSV